MPITVQGTNISTVLPAADARPAAAPRADAAVIRWLLCVGLAVCLTVVVGGATRLTQSGLSMVDWRPVAGIVPPLTQADWQAEFDAYKQYPEYRKVNRGMSLGEFKSIFHWEYAHRMLGRLTGLLFFVPFMYFLFRGRIARQWTPWLWVALALGGLQGLMGWYMVKSGLVDVPQVSHYRLAAHLFLALAILALLAWLVLDMARARRHGISGSQKLLTWASAALLGLQMLLGAFTAGLKAGHGFNTYPMMHGQFLADAALTMRPFWRNFIENGVMAQFAHRWLGAALLAAVAALALVAARNRKLAGPSLLLAALTALQFALGVVTLLANVPVALGSMHQAVACLMVIVLACLAYQGLLEKAR